MIIVVTNAPVTKPIPNASKMVKFGIQYIDFGSKTLAHNDRYLNRNMSHLNTEFLLQKRLNDVHLVFIRKTCRSNKPRLRFVAIRG
jgi:hypothetical protein